MLEKLESQKVVENLGIEIKAKLDEIAILQAKLDEQMT